MAEISFGLFNNIQSALAGAESPTAFRILGIFIDSTKQEEGNHGLEL
ncbi:hypothetical protein [Desulfosporosinus nitroreducens]|nr:hypothetical protein [Desulfosporosinus nitroreducens]MCO1602838.1 hypothetical protein [Desulfosporosinus nitroreducens]